MECLSNIGLRDPNIETLSVDVLAQDLVEMGYYHLNYLIKRDWILPFGQVRPPKKNEYSLDALRPRFAQCGVCLPHRCLRRQNCLRRAVVGSALAFPQCQGHLCIGSMF